MDKKDQQLLEKLFAEAEYKDLSSILLRFTERNQTIAEVFNRPIVPEHLANINKETAVLRILMHSDVYPVLNYGIYHGYKNKDLSLLNNCLFANNRLTYHRSITLESGYDHCIYLRNVIESFCACDYSLIAKIFSEEKGLTQRGHKFLLTASNLMISLLYKNETWLKESEQKAEKFLGQKNSAFECSVIRYLLALSQKNITVISEELNSICTLYKKANWLHDFNNPFLKVFAVFIHGLYNFSHHILTKELSEQIHVPEYTALWPEFIAYNKSTGFTKGVPVLKFDHELSGLNSIFE